MILFLTSCVGWLDKEQFKELQINSEYKIDYMKYPEKEIKSFGLIYGKGGGISGGIVETIYNNNYIYYKCDSTIWKDFYMQLKIDLDNPKLGDHSKKNITREEYEDFKSTCKDCTILNLDSLNKMDKDIPPIIMGKKQNETKANGNK